MKHSFSCPQCGTQFTVDIPDQLRVALCPACGTPNIVPISDEIGSVTENIKAAAVREKSWMLRAALIFLGIWILVVSVMLLVNRQPASPVVTSTPSPSVTESTPAPAPPVATVPAPPVVQSPLPTSQPAPPIASSKPAPPEIREVPKKPALADAQIVASIRKGIDFLLANFKGAELDRTLSADQAEHEGMNALAVYALLHCSQSIRDERINVGGDLMKSLIDAMKRHRITATTNSRAPITYARSLRASALAIYNRPEDREALAADLSWLLRAAQDGAYTYDDVYLRPGQANGAARPASPTVHAAETFIWDNSNSQYGLLGVWSCADAGLPVPNRYWLDVEKHWISFQRSGGMWSYIRSTDSTFSMTVAGITAMSVCRDHMGDEPTALSSQTLRKAISWLETDNNAVAVSGPIYGYSLYGLERAALASGMMFAGRHDIYRELSNEVVPKQRPTGAWVEDSGHNAVIETAFALLFLARGRNPVMLNKLRYDGGWSNHSRDCANLAKYASYAMERPVNWQVVNLNQPWSQWLESPILYIAGDIPPLLSPADYDHLRSYVDSGGLILTHSDNDSALFNDFVQTLAARLFPKYAMEDVPADDELFTLQFPINQPRPKFRMVTNGSRRLMLHCMNDVAGKWQTGDSRQYRSAFELGINLFIYATGRAELRSKIDSPYVATPSTQAARTLPIARVQYIGTWAPEPGAWPQFERYFWTETGWALQSMPVEAAKLKASDFAFAHLTGTAISRPSTLEAEGLRKFIADGGVIFIDCCGGSQRFGDTFKRDWIPAICPSSETRLLPENDPIFTGKIAGVAPAASDLQRMTVRPYTAQVSRPSSIRLYEVRSGKGRIIFSELDVTTGLIGTNIWGISGYSPAYAQALLKNIALDAISTHDRM